MAAAYTDKFLGVETATSQGYGPIVVRDGLGSEITVPAGERRAFSVQLDADGRFFWRDAGERYEGFPVIESTKLSWRETNYVQVTRDAGRNITWACYERQSAGAAFLVPPSAPAPPMAAGGGAFAPASRDPATAPPRLGAGGDRTSAGSRLTVPSAAAEGEWARQSFNAARIITNNLLEYIEEAPRRLSYMCMFGGLAISLNGAFEVLNVFDVFDSTVRYLVHCYMVFFGLVTCITELHADATPQLYENFRTTQKWMHDWALGLTTLWGRGLFHIFQGSLAIAASSSLGLGIVTGCYMLVMGFIYLYLHFKGAPATCGDYINIGEN